MKKEVHKITLPKGWEVDKIENGEIILKESDKERFYKDGHWWIKLSDHLLMLDEDLELDGKKSLDWFDSLRAAYDADLRLPTKEELEKYKNIIYKYLYKDTPIWIWSSTEYSQDGSWSFYCGSYDCGLGWFDKGYYCDDYRVRAVKDI